MPDELVIVLPADSTMTLYGWAPTRHPGMYPDPWESFVVRVSRTDTLRLRMEDARCGDIAMGLHAVYLHGRTPEGIPIGGWSAEVTRLVIARQIRVGMTAAQVREAWGQPRRVNRTTTATGVGEQWVYSGGYAYLTNGVVTAIQN